ncbi:MAG: DNA polymerase IV [Planctomycetota bacterium]
MSGDRSILHADMDAFFASVEQRDDPSLRSKPVLVGGSGGRGVVTAASYEAREFGCRSAMPMSVALRLCPHAICVRGRYDAYKQASARVFEIFESVTPLVQPLSIDEAFLDVTGSRRAVGDAVSIAKTVRERMLAETGLTASVGVAPNKFLAKLASDMDKPDGLTVIEADKVQQTLDPLPVTRIFGVGGSAEKRLNRLGVRTIGDLRKLPVEAVTSALGSWGARVHELAHGIDDRPVVPDRVAKSVGHEQTFGVDLTEPDDVRAVMLDQAEQVGRRLRAKGRKAKTVTVKIRFGDFQTITRAQTLERAVDDTDSLYVAARSLFDAWAEVSFRPVRLIGVSASQLTGDGEPEQLGLFEDAGAQEKRRAVDAAFDAINEKFGKRVITRAGAIRRDGKGKRER